MKKEGWPMKFVAFTHFYAIAHEKQMVVLSTESNI